MYLAPPCRALLKSFRLVDDANAGVGSPGGHVAWQHRPGVCPRVVNFHRLQIGRAVIATDDIQKTVVGNDSCSVGLLFT